MAEPEHRKILTPHEAGKIDYDPTWGNIVHVSGKDPEADRAWEAMGVRQKAADERAEIAIERYRATRLGAVQQFDQYVAEGRFRQFISTLNFLELKQQCKIEKQLAFGVGAALGFIIALLLLR